MDERKIPQAAGMMPLPKEIDRQSMPAFGTDKKAGFAEGGIPIGAALITGMANCLGADTIVVCKHGDPSAHGENYGAISP